MQLPVTVAIHASSDDSRLVDDVAGVTEEYDDAFYAFENEEYQVEPGKTYFYSQAIVGLVDIVGSMQIDPDWDEEETIKRVVDAGFTAEHGKWAFAPYAFFLSNPRRFSQGIQCSGSTLFWKVRPEVQDHILNQAILSTLPRRAYATDESPLCELLPRPPHGIVKVLGSPNYSELKRKASAKTT